MLSSHGRRFFKAERDIENPEESELAKSDLQDAHRKTVYITVSCLVIAIGATIGVALAALAIVSPTSRCCDLGVETCRESNA